MVLVPRARTAALFDLQFFHEPLNTAAVLVELRSVLEAWIERSKMWQRTAAYFERNKVRK